MGACLRCSRMRVREILVAELAFAAAAAADAY